jgi:hypothetical protein
MGDWKSFENYCIYFNSLKLENIKSRKQTLALINFFGTLVWGENGEINCMNHTKLVLCSPFIELIFDDLNDKGYTLCILEVCNYPNTLNKIKRCIKGFLDVNKLKLPAIIINKNEVKNINKIVYNIFQPDEKFGGKSFYVGNEIDLYDANPWNRISDIDSVIAKSLEFNLMSSDNLFGGFLNYMAYFMMNSLIITCGHEYSGYDILYESIEEEILHLGMECKVKSFLDKKIYFIWDYILNDYFKNNDKIIIKENEHYVALGCYPSFKDRKYIVSKFETDNMTEYTSVIALYTKFPYEKYDGYKNYIKLYESPTKTGEKWFRLN